MSYSHRSILGISLLVVVMPTLAQQHGLAGRESQVCMESGDGLQWTIQNENDEAVRVAVSTDSNKAAATSPSGAQPLPHSAQPHKFGPLTVLVDWRFRTEAWDWFQPVTGQNAYAFEHSLVRIGLGQKSENLEWFLEGAQDAILDLPTGAVLAGNPGQLGLGGTYFAANGKGQNNANGFVRQAYVGFKLPAGGKLRLGRFTFLDGAELTRADKSLSTLVNTRIAQRLIGDFGFSAVGRSFDGAQDR